MKVLIIHTSYKQKGGEDTVLANEYAMLLDAGIDARLLVFSNEGGTIAKFLQLPFNYSTYLETLNVIAEFKPDVAHVHNLHFGGSASVIYALKNKKIPTVMTLHNYRLLCPSGTLFNRGQIFLDSLHAIFPWKALRQKAYLDSWIFTFWLSFSMMIHQRLGTWLFPQKYIVLGEHTKELFAHSKMSAITSRMIVKPNFCPPSATDENPRGYYLYLGRLSEEKGIGVLLTAFAKNGLDLRIAGAGPLVNTVIGVAASHHNIQFLGSVNSHIAADLLKGAKALIFPSLWYETFGMVIIEAFAAKTPVIASFLGQLKFTIDDKVNGLHFNAGDVEDLCLKISYYEQLNDVQKNSYEINAKLKYDRFFAPDENLRQLVSLYSEMKTEKALKHDE